MANKIELKGRVSKLFDEMESSVAEVCKKTDADKVDIRVAFLLTRVAELELKMDTPQWPGGVQHSR